MAKIIFALTAMISSVSAWALPAPPDFLGTHNFAGSIRHLNTQHIEVVHTHSADGQQKLKDLIADNFICSPAQSSTYRCRKNTKEEIPAQLKATIIQAAQNFPIEFEKATSDWSLTGDGDSLKEFSRLQVSRYKGKSFTSIRYLMLDGINKIVLENGSGEKEWINLYDGAMRLPITTSKTFKPTHFNIYMVELEFE